MMYRAIDFSAQLQEWYVQWFPNVSKLHKELQEATIETLYMTFMTALIAGTIGLILGVILVVTEDRGILPNRVVFHFFDKFVNITRSIPFIILLTLMIPITKFFFQKTIGMWAAVSPLSGATIPFFARQVQLALVSVDRGIVEAAQAMGTSPLGIIFRVYLREGLPALIRASSNTMISLIGLTAMVGAIGSGGIGQLAISRGYNRFQDDVTFVTTIIILSIVFLTQWIGRKLEKLVTH